MVKMMGQGGKRRLKKPVLHFALELVVILIYYGSEFYSRGPAAGEVLSPGLMSLTLVADSFIVPEEQSGNVGAYGLPLPSSVSVSVSAVFGLSVLLRMPVSICLALGLASGLGSELLAAARPQHIHGGNLLSHEEERKKSSGLEIR
ncbi:hypothetical protein AAES_51389 [Amazona aestiva]|uniref:Uncharacterized protein n=1 Tax=Amazona aestiva TaxID=12930 RepID=A0A0Q3PSI8_AMAAE|nr:hypothetical protein AAES_51389 [Amazona aestiva]